MMHVEAERARPKPLRRRQEKGRGIPGTAHLSTRINREAKRKLFEIAKRQGIPISVFIERVTELWDQIEGTESVDERILNIISTACDAPRGGEGA